MVAGTSAQAHHSFPGFVKVAAKRRRLGAFIRLNVIAAWMMSAMSAALLIFQLVAAVARMIRNLPPFGRSALFSPLISQGFFWLQLAFTVLFTVYLVRRRDPRVRLRGLVAASDELDQRIKSAVQSVLGALRIEPTHLHFYLWIDSRVAQAYALRVRGENYLVMTPAVAIAVRHGDPTASAVVAHEMAHFQQGDCDVFAVAFRYVELYILYSVVANLIYIFSFGDPIIRYTSIPLATLITFGFLVANRRLRRMSERSADLFAVLIGRAEGLIDALKRSPKDSSERSFAERFVDFHPSPGERVRSIEKALAILRGETPKDPGARPGNGWVYPTFFDYAGAGLLMVIRGVGLSILAVITLVGEIALSVDLHG